MQNTAPLRFSRLALPLSAALAAAPFTAAAQESAVRWSSIGVGDARLLPAGGAAPGAQAGIHIRLGQGWKTYWRSPGEAGMPPSFDWSGSKNLRRADILWPAPKRFEDGGVMSVGYVDDILFPVSVVPEDPSKPVSLDVLVTFGVCKDICLPREARLSLSLSPRSDDNVAQGPHDALIARYLSRVPRMGEGDEPPALERAFLSGTAKSMRIVADVRVPPGERSTDLFAEADGVALALPVASGDARDDIQRFEVPISAEDAAHLLDKPVRYTIVSGGRAREAEQRLIEGPPAALQGSASP